MTKSFPGWTRGSILLLLLCASSIPLPAANYSLLGWNNLGMHCMDSDYSVFSILPPYNTIEAQLIVGGKLVTSSAGYTVTYQAVADPTGSINTTAAGKTTFYDYVGPLYGANPAMDVGLAGWAMPGTNNTPQSMLFETQNTGALVNWFRAEGIPLTPYDDAGKKNPYPLMRLVARDASGQILATSAIVLPVSDEMDCRACHASGSGDAAKPAAGWVSDTNSERDYRLNILRLHDEKRDAASWPGILASNGFNPQGLFAGVVHDHKPVLCAKCHLSEALPGTGFGSIPPLTRSVHSLHAKVMDPAIGTSLGSAINRSACYRCHPGSATRCLRGAMGAAVANDGTMALQCQSCHGGMSQVGSSNRTGWLMEPKCQSCHTGTATHNNGQIRYTSVFQSTGVERAAVDQTFATQPNTPAAGLSLYRFSAGHGGLQCEACHGSTHAEFPSTHANDNLRNIQLQGHAGVLSECTACHVTMPSTVTGGPHGMHPVGQAWVNQHGSLFENGGAGVAQCATCHGPDYRGTVLSRSQADRSLLASTENGTTTVQFFRGSTIGCFACHDGPGGEGINGSAPPTVSSISARTTPGQPVTFNLPASGVSLSLRIISQPAHGTVGLNGVTATYFPEPGFSGTDTFTFAAYDGSKNSGLGYGTVAVAGQTVDTTPPVITVTSPRNGTRVTSTQLTLSGTATDSGAGNNGVVSVLVNGVQATGGSVAGAGTASWKATITLNAGQNTISIVAKDQANNSATTQIGVKCILSTNYWTLYWQNNGGTVSCWDMADCQQLGSRLLTSGSITPGWRIVGAGQFGGDVGKDLVWQHTDGSLSIWCLDGTNCIDQLRPNPSRLSAGWQVMATADLDNDGQHDLICQHTNGWVGVWLMDSTNATSQYLNPSKVDPSWKIAAAGDFNGDGKTDLVFQHTDGRLAVWFMDGTNRTGTTYLNPARVDSSWKLVGSIDFNRDGHIELLWRNTNGRLSYWQMNGTNRVGGTAFDPATADSNWRIVGQQ